MAIGKIKLLATYFIFPLSSNVLFLNIANIIYPTFKETKHSQTKGVKSLQRAITWVATYLIQKILDPMTEHLVLTYAYVPILAMLSSPSLLYITAQGQFATLPKEIPTWQFLLIVFPLLISLIAINRKNKVLSINKHKYMTHSDDLEIAIGVTVPVIVTPQGGYSVSEDILCETHKTTLIHLPNSVDHACQNPNCNTLLKGRERQFTFTGADRAVRTYIRKQLKTEPYELDIYSMEGARLLPPWHKE